MEVLPEELLLEIFSRAESEAVIQTIQTCKHFHHISIHQKLWKTMFLKRYGSFKFWEPADDFDWRHAFTNRFVFLIIAMNAYAFVSSVPL
jgi:hypothetical protein